MWPGDKWVAWVLAEAPAIGRGVGEGIPIVENGPR